MTTTTLRSVPDAPATIGAMSSHDRFQLLRSELAGEILESGDRIDGALTALVAGEHMAMIGAPGTAKTMLVDRIMLRMTGARYFSELMRKTMPPETVYGQVSIVGMKEDVWRYVTTGMLPEADIALLDEFVRTSDAINNGLLTILNERRFKNGADMMQVPLSTAFLCANALPTSDDEQDLDAFWDRVVMRFVVTPPVDRETWRQIARMRLDPAPPILLDYADVLAAKAEARALPFAEATYDAIDEIRVVLAAEGITMSPRRLRQAQFVAAAWAWLEGDAEVLPVHCEILRHMLWEVPEQQDVVARKIAETVSPGQKRAIELQDMVQEFATNVAAALALQPDARGALLNELFAKSQAQRAELDEFLTEAEGRALRTAETASKAQDAAHSLLMSEGFGVKIASLAGVLPA